jgi:hypothetical protein
MLPAALPELLPTEMFNEPLDVELPEAITTSPDLPVAVPDIRLNRPELTPDPVSRTTSPLDPNLPLLDEET